MWMLGQRLEWAGLTVINISYPSTEESVDRLAEHVHRELEHEVGTHAKLDFVTHSLGALVLRTLLVTHQEIPVGRIVMLAPPNQGSLVADRLHDHAAWRWIAGPAGQQLGQGHDGVAARLPGLAVETGVIAGHCSINPIASYLIPGPDDGAVGIDSTFVAGMRDFLSLCQAHSFLMFDPRVYDEVQSFLLTGAFAHAQAGPVPPKQGPIRSAEGRSSAD